MNPWSHRQSSENISLMSEDERLELLRTATEVHAGLKELALRLRRRLTSKAPATKAAVKAEQEVFRLSSPW